MLFRSGQVEPVWEQGCRAFGLEDCIDDPRLGSDENIAKNNAQRELYRLMSDAVGRRTFAEWNEWLLEQGIVHERVAHSRDLVCDAQALANGYIEKATLPDGKETFYPTIPVQFSEYKTKPVNTQVDEGQDTKAILEELGYTVQQIEGMYTNKAVR